MVYFLFNRTIHEYFVTRNANHALFIRISICITFFPTKTIKLTFKPRYSKQSALHMYFHLQMNHARSSQEKKKERA